MEKSNEGIGGGMLEIKQRVPLSLTPRLHGRWIKCCCRRGGGGGDGRTHGEQEEAPLIARARKRRGSTSEARLRL